MIKLLNSENIDEAIKLLNKYHKNEDEKCEIVANRSKEDIENIILNGAIYGNYKNYKLVGIASFERYNAINGLQKTKLENRVRKEKFFKQNNISSENTVVFLNDLIDKESRGQSIYKELNAVRIKKVKELGYKHIVAYLNINKVDGINDFIKNGWKFGTLIEISKNRYEFLLHYEIQP